jgi:hypothetical protein
MKPPENNLITIFTHKEVTLLYKTFLEIVEDLRCDTNSMLAKVAEKVGPQFAKDINFFTDEKYEQLRKRVLDQGNECSRRLLAFLDFFEFIINKEKVEEAARQKRQTTKKFVTSAPILVE